MNKNSPTTVWLLSGAVLLAVGLGGLALLAKTMWDGQVAAWQAVEARVTALEHRLGDLQTLLDTAQTQSASLKNQLEGSLMTLQDVYFDALKKNDGLAAVWSDPRPGRRAYLSFDDGPTENTPLVLDALKARKVHATFFVNGRTEWSALYGRILKEGHKLGNHTYSHDYNAVYQSVDAYLKDTEKLDTLLAGLGLPPSKLYRFPGGAKNEFAARLGGPDLTGRISAAMADRGYRFFEWNVVAGEGESRPDSGLMSPDEIRRAVLAQAKNKRIAVVLLHDGPGHRNTALAVPAVIDGLKRLGFSFETLP